MHTKRFFSTLLVALLGVAGAWAQYLNVKLADGTWRSFKTSSDMEVSFGDKKGTDPTESTQSVTVNGHTVAVKLADDTPTSEVMLSIHVEGEKVKIEAFSKLNHGLWCSKDNNGEVLETNFSNGFHTFTLSNISNDVVVTLGYINVSFDLNNSGMDASFTAKPDDIKKVGYNTTINEPDRLFSDKYGFRGWYKDKECTEAWNFSTGVTKSMTLYAKWKEDPTGTQINGHDYVKLAGYYWATQNVYMANVPDEYAGDKNYGSYYTQEHYSALNAANSWRDTWTLPSEAQWRALLKYCNWEWYTNYNGTGMNGMLVTGKAEIYESNHSIFLPAAGFYIDDRSDVLYQSYQGLYWSADNGSYLLFDDQSFCNTHNGNIPYGLSVRPVLAE